DYYCLILHNNSWLF
nr:immunoglobulin light chain junction region [Macaca mulatta]MOY05173.1 immunoglobulin light chain junction region [Macaca mulatta]MOY05223.1 immunoglobulin light chain junction region [Macaca mulatta]MOY05367.1 immunoglobulin light chain junction region [Macaca mulatta]MOY05411.1 immunoglobulin light chain junction region [Macaca mulatta]